MEDKNIDKNLNNKYEVERVRYKVKYRRYG